MKKSLLFMLSLGICLLLGCSTIASNDSQLPPESNDLATPGLEKPDAMEELADNQNVQWMAGMMAALENAEIRFELSTDHYVVYTDPGNVVKANITVQNGLNKSQRFNFMIYADGIPVNFKVNGMDYKSYPVDLTPEPKIISVEFEKDFSQNLGRLDFVMSYTEKLQGDFHIASHTLWIRQNGKVIVPASLCSTVEQREGIQGKYSGDVFDAWIWNEGVSPTAMDQMGPRTISIHSEETILLEEVAAKPGLYRTVLVVGETPVNFEWNGTQYSYIDWESTGTNMLQLPIQLTDIPSNGSFYTVTTPLDMDALAQNIMASSRIEFTEDGEA